MIKNTSFYDILYVNFTNRKNKAKITEFMSPKIFLLKIYKKTSKLSMVVGVRDCDIGDWWHLHLYSNSCMKTYPFTFVIFASKKFIFVKGLIKNISFYNILYVNFTNRKNKVLNVKFRPPKMFHLKIYKKTSNFPIAVGVRDFDIRVR